MNYADVFSPVTKTEETQEDPQSSYRVKDLKRVMDGCIVAYEVTKCSRCLGIVDTGGNKDKFCRHCGARLEGLYGRPE